MAKTLLKISYDNRNTKLITAPMILRADIVPWLLCLLLPAALLSILYWALTLVEPSQSREDVILRTLPYLQNVKLILIFCTVLLVRRSKQAWTWILAVLLVFAEFSLYITNVIEVFAPYLLLSSMTIFLLILCAERLYEYIHMRRTLKMQEPALSRGALAVYIGTIVCALLLLSPSFYALIWR